MLSVAVARFISDDSAIPCVVPFLWMTSCFHIMGSESDVTFRWVWRHRIHSCYPRLQACSLFGEFFVLKWSVHLRFEWWTPRQ